MDDRDGIWTATLPHSGIAGFERCSGVGLVLMIMNPKCV